MKKSFLFHLDSLKILEKMTDEQAGVFIKKIYEYQKTGSIKDLDFAMEMAIIPFLNQFERDNEKWKDSSTAGRIGNLKKYNQDIFKRFLAKEISLDEAEKEAKEIKAFKGAASSPPTQPDTTNRGRSLNVNVNDNVNVNVNNSNPLPKILDKKTPTPRGSGGVFKKIDLVGGVGVKLLKVIDITGQLTGKDIQEIERLASGWDIEHLAKVYVDGINSGSREAPRSIPKAFPQWCAKYTKGKRP